MTSLFGGTKLSKKHIRIEAYGTIDELNSFIGLLRDHVQDEHLKSTLLTIQKDLFVIGSNLAVEDPSQFKLPALKSSSVKLLEEEIDNMEKNLPKLKYFVLPGGNPNSSFCHLARVVCRRAERRVVALSETSKVEERILEFLNRLSDYLFVLSRSIIHKEGAEEIYWIPES